MAEQTVTLNPSEAKVVVFEATPHEAKTYQVSVNGLAGSFTAKELALSYKIPVKAVAESTYSAKYAARKAIDNDFGTHWFGLAGHCCPNWIYFDLGSKKRIGGVKAAIFPSDVPQRHNIQISDDASSWKTVVSGWVVSVGNTLKEKTFPAMEGRYIRLYITASNRRYGTCTEFRAGILG